MRQGSASGRTAASREAVRPPGPGDKAVDGFSIGAAASADVRRVRDQVLARTNNAQEPFTYGSLPAGELYFKQAAAR